MNSESLDYAIKCIGFDPRYLSEDESIEVLKEHPYAFEFMESKSPQLCEFALQLYPDYLEFIPPYIVTENMCIDAIIRKPKCIKFVPKKFLTPEFIQTILPKAPRIVLYLGFSEENFIRAVPF